MIFLLGLILDFVDYVIGLFKDSENELEDAVSTVEFLTQTSQYDKKILPVPVLSSKITSKHGIWWSDGAWFYVCDDAFKFSYYNVSSQPKIWKTKDFINFISIDWAKYNNSWDDFAARLIPASYPKTGQHPGDHLNYNQINAPQSGVMTDFGQLVGSQFAPVVTPISFVAREPSALDNSKFSYAQRYGSLASFLINGKRVVLGGFAEFCGRFLGWAHSTSLYNKTSDNVSPGWFTSNNSYYQAYSTFENEIMHRYVNGVKNMNSIVAMTEDAENNIYALHSSAYDLVLSKNFVPVDSWVIDSLELSQSLATPTNRFVNDAGLSNINMCFHGGKIAISQFRKIYICDLNFTLESIYETPFSFEQMFSSNDGLCFANNSGVTICRI
jgi:hypothetical protein